MGKFRKFEPFLYHTSDYDSLCREQEYPGYAVYYKRRSDKVEEEDVANINLFVQLLEIDSKLGSVNEDQLAGLLICPFPNINMINVTFNDVVHFFYLSFRSFQPRIDPQRISVDTLRFIWRKIMTKKLTKAKFILITT